MSTADKLIVGPRLRAAREAAPRWSRATLARLMREAADPRDRAGMPHVTSLADMIKQWENGRWIPESCYRALYAKVTGKPESELFGLGDTTPTGTAQEVVDLAMLLERSNVGDGTLDWLRTATRRLAFDYPRRPPLDVLRDARQLQARVDGILRGGRQRLAQTRALLDTSAELFALITLLAGDVGRYDLADSYGYAAWTCADEGDSDMARALVLCAQSKTARWERRFAEAAELARRGFDLCPAVGRGRVLLAVSEATALQSRGDITSATEALEKAHRAREQLTDADGIADAWGCTRAREATYALQVGLGSQDAARVLRSVRDADDAWANGDQWVYGTWAQVRIGAGLAHIMRGDPEGAAAELEKVFDLASEYRVVTIIGRMDEIARRLEHNRFAADPHAGDLCERIRAFKAGSLEHKALTTPEVL